MYLISPIKKYWEGFLHLIYPRICLQCGSEKLINEQVLCSSCYAQLPFTDFLGIENNAVEKIFWGRVSLGASGAALFFTKDSIVQLLLFELKYKQNKKAGWMLGNILGLALQQSNCFQHIDYLIPIPIRPQKERSRGFNQSMVICEGIIKVLPIPILSTILIKKKGTLTQTNKDRLARASHTIKLFQLKKAALIFNKKLLLVDDVITTGATAESACLCLLQANPSSVQFAAVAYTLP